jgi:hypothetical protein
MRSEPVKQCPLFILIFFLAACGMDNPIEKPTRVFIRSNGAVVTTYNLGDGGQILQSSTVDRYGGAVSRQYSYTAGNELDTVSRQSAAGRAVTLSMTKTRDRGNRLSGATKTIVGPDGVSTEIKVDYFYAENGKLDGLIQTDPNGNVQSKCGED